MLCFILKEDSTNKFCNLNGSRINEAVPLRDKMSALTTTIGRLLDKMISLQSLSAWLENISLTDPVYFPSRSLDAFSFLFPFTSSISFAPLVDDQYVHLF